MRGELVGDEGPGAGEHLLARQQFQRRRGQRLARGEVTSAVGADALKASLEVGAHDLVGVTSSPEQYRWLRENFTPTETVANEYLVYQISPQQFDEKCAQTGFCK